MTDIRLDDWANDLATLGSIRDKATGLKFQRRSRLQREELEALYEQGPIPARVVDKLPFEAFREGWALDKIKTTNDSEIDVPALMERLQAELLVDERFAQASRWSRLYGGNLMTLPIVDGRKPSEPIDLVNAQLIFPPNNIVADDAPPLTYDSAFGSPTYRQILSYQVAGLNTTAALLDVHHSRTIAFEPIELPLEARLRSFSNNGWGPSVLDRLFDDLGKEGSTRSHAVSMLYLASILVVKLEGLRAALKTKGGKEDVRKILDSMRSNMDVLGLLGLDKADEIITVQHTITGIDKLITVMRNALAAAADMPREILFNESPEGLSAGELSGPQEIWFATVRAYQKDVLTPALRRFLEIVFVIWNVPIASFQIKWAPLFVKSEETTAETAKKNAEADAIYMAAGVVTPEQVRKHRFVDGRMDPLEITVEEADAMAVEQAATLAAAPAPPDMPEPDDALSVEDAAVRLGMHTRTLTAAMGRGELRHWGIGKRRTVSLAEVAALSRGHETPPVSEITLATPTE